MIPNTPLNNEQSKKILKANFMLTVGAVVVGNIISATLLKSCEGVRRSVDAVIQQSSKEAQPKDTEN